MKKAKNIVVIVITSLLVSCLSAPVQIPTETTASTDTLLISSATVTLTPIMTRTATATAIETPLPTATYAPRSRVVEEAAVYLALLNDELERPFGLVLEDSILIINRTYKITSYQIVEDDYLFGHVTALDKDTIEDFRTVNQDADAIDLSLSVGKPYEYISLEQLKNYPKDVFVTGFSKVGFNPELDQALAYKVSSCGIECGTGKVYFLVRKENIWEIQNVILLWEQ